jgi:hypothetical protein
MTDAMTIYQRTAQGQWAAYNLDSPLPRKLKILLKSIDGRVSDDVYAVNLKSFGNVQEILHSLMQSGLIEDIHAPRKKSSKKTPGPESLAELHPEPELTVAALSAATPATQSASLPARKLEFPKPVQRTAQVIQLPEPAHLQSASITPDPGMGAWALGVATQSMTQFVLTHLPEGAFQVLPEIDALKSMDQLGVLMDGYAQFVASAGPASEAHLAEIRALIDASQGGSNQPGLEAFA